MHTISPRNLKKRAASLTKNSSDFRKIVLLHGAVMLGVSLAIFLLQLLLDYVAPSQSGLSGFQTAAIFSTAQSTLSTLYNILIPFWQIGILFAAIRATRRQSVEFSDLTQGFRRWGVVLRFYILLYVASIAAIIVISLGISIATSLLSPIYHLIMPAPEGLAQLASEQFLQDFEAAIAAGDASAMVKLIPLDVIYYVLPLMLILLASCIVAILHLYYRIRLSQYLLVDDPAVGARASIVLSNRMVKGHKWKLFLLDLSFWWYGLLNLLPIAITLLPSVLALCKVSLPIPDLVLSLICQLLSAGISLGILWLFGSYVEGTYACAYDELRTPPQVITAPDYYEPRN